jgi:hypothetical protein
MLAILRNLSPPQRMEMLWQPLVLRSAGLVANPVASVANPAVASVDNPDTAVTARALPPIVAQAR